MQANIGVPIFKVNRNSDFLLHDNIGMTIGQRIKACREDLGWTQKELAAKVGIKQPTLSELEIGDSKGSTHLPEIASALGVNALWLQKEKGPKLPIKNLTAKELLIINAYRDATPQGQSFIEMTCEAAPRKPRGAQ